MLGLRRTRAPLPLAVPLDHPRCRLLRPLSSGDPGESSLGSGDSMRRPGTTTARLRVRRRAWGRSRIPNSRAPAAVQTGPTACWHSHLGRTKLGFQNCWLPENPQNPNSWVAGSHRLLRRRADRHERAPVQPAPPATPCSCTNYPSRLPYPHFLRSISLTGPRSSRPCSTPAWSETAPNSPGRLGAPGRG